jgi:glycosyltransferase involved in cell wall biosynthesis
MFEVLTNADFILPISKSTQRDIKVYCDRYKIPQTKSEVIPLGNKIESTEEHQPEWVDTNESFTICVGTIEIRKNHLSLYYAYKEILSRGETPPKLYIVGREGWYISDLKMLLEQDPYINKLIQIKSNVTDSELAWLYKNCLFSVYPSVYEGWGLPVSESLARGTPVLSSNLSSMPEAGGEFAEYFSPYNTGQMADLIIKNTKDTLSLSAKRKYIRKNFRQTSWEESYKKINAIIKKNLL